MKLTSIFALVLAWVTLSGAAQAFEPRTTGVVLMHGKWGSAGDKTTAPLAHALHDAGFTVDQPDMPWSGSRAYDMDYDAAMNEIDAAVARLRAAGAQKIVVAGQSLGANAALHYAGLGKPIDAYVLVAPGHFPDSPMSRQQMAGSIAQARQMIAEGKGDDLLAIIDHNSGDRTRSMNIKAAIFLTYFLPDGPAAMSVSAPKVGAAPILWVAGRMDPGTGGFERAVWPRMPPSTPTFRIDVNGDHLDVPEAGRAVIVQWLRER